MHSFQHSVKPVKSLWCDLFTGPRSNIDQELGEFPESMQVIR